MQDIIDNEIKQRNIKNLEYLKGIIDNFDEYIPEDSAIYDATIGNDSEMVKYIYENFGKDEMKTELIHTAALIYTAKVGNVKTLVPIIQRNKYI